MIQASIPSPTQSVWHLGPLPLRAYALCIILGIVAACVVTERRMRSRGAPPSTVLDIAVWAVPFGIVGARIYHVITSPGPYFGADGDPIKALYIWEGGLGIWGAVAGGAVGAWIACRRLGIPLRFVADALAPGLPLAQGIGRWGNWFNNELHGAKTDLPWGLKVYEFDPSQGAAVRTATGEPSLAGTFHPTFLYESLWDIGVAILVWQLDKRYRFGRGRAFAVYVMAYTLGRVWIEAMRTDEASDVLGLRLNVWTSIIVFAGALAYFLRVKGPQERLIVAEDGTVTVVPITDGETAAETEQVDLDKSDPDKSDPDPADPDGDDPPEPDATAGTEESDDSSPAAPRPAAP